METLHTHGVTLHGCALGSQRTSIHVPEYGAVFDAGVMLDVATDRVFITHAHPDHISALPSIVARRSIQTNANPLDIYVPNKIASHLEDALNTMEYLYGNRARTSFRVHGIRVDEEVKLEGGRFVRALKTFHTVPSLGWALGRWVKKLKPEFEGTPDSEFAKLRARGTVFDERREFIECVIPGDTRVEFLASNEVAQSAKVLVHEVTFWDDEHSIEKCRAYGHTHISEMIEHCEKFTGAKLVLVHRSPRYARDAVETIVEQVFPESMRSKICVFDGGDST